ncbi:putative amidohydrolase [Planifilum fimeticola]|uniref:Putative amidohydrolase n=1 Tax=Planifilum fimeticola TaxID=201975 RepID=A0A2T0LBT4_9BACL|nr:nitrilase-related carbon-nitrogen hydrolase [Planifilum fimeticola]PRX39415.1 putative amidohydrolase [Planifilum fimeticola]
MRVGLAQIRPVLGRVEENLKLHREMIRRAESERVDLLVFPELSLTGYSLKDLTLDVARTLRDESIRRLVGESGRIDLVFGLVEEGPGHLFYNAAVYASEGKIRHVHRKVYLPTYGMFEEARHFARGRSFRSFETRFGRMGLLICEDAWHPSAPYLLVQDGAEFLLVLSNAPAKGMGARGMSAEETWYGLLTNHSLLHGTITFYTNRVGTEDGITFFGGSAAIDPFGRILARGERFEPQLVMIDVNPEDVRLARYQMPMLRDEDLELTAREIERIVKRRSEGRELP